MSGLRFLISAASDAARIDGNLVAWTWLTIWPPAAIASPMPGACSAGVRSAPR
jgi:hypothetical protein